MDHIITTQPDLFCCQYIGRGMIEVAYYTIIHQQLDTFVYDSYSHESYKKQSELVCHYSGLLSVYIVPFGEEVRRKTVTYLNNYGHLILCYLPSSTTPQSAPMVQWLRGHTSEPKVHEFEPHRCHLVRAYGRRYVQVRPVRPKISHFNNNFVRE